MTSADIRAGKRFLGCCQSMPVIATIQTLELPPLGDGETVEQ